MTEEEKKQKKVPQKGRRSYTGGALYIVTTAFIIIILTGAIAFGVQRVMGAGKVNIDEGVVVDGIREFRISTPQWYFNPVTIKVNPGDTVRFIVTSPDIMHGFAINELGVNLALKADVGVVAEVEIPADIPEGVYTSYCSIFCGIGHPYMKGSVIIGERGFEIGRIIPYVSTGIMVGIFAASIIIIGRRREL